MRDEYYLTDSGVRLHAVADGAGCPVVLVHGFPEFWRAWRHQIGPLAAAGFRPIALDLRGYNLSDAPPGTDAYRLPLLVSDVASVIRRAGGRAHVVGHDWGGVIAWTLAGCHPELVDRLVIVNAPHPQVYRRIVWRSSQAIRSWYVLLFQLRGIAEGLLRVRRFAALRRVFRADARVRRGYPPDEIARYVDAWERPGTLTAALNYYRANARPLASGHVNAARIDRPTLVIWGERDPALSPRLLEGLERVAPGVSVQRLPDVGHWVPNEAPRDFTRRLLEFLS